MMTSKTAIVYTLPDCPRCDNAKNVLAALGYSVEVREAKVLARGDIHDNEASAEFHMNDGAVPIIIIDGRSVREGDELYDLVKEHKEW
jgi:glutaredoxin